MKQLSILISISLVLAACGLQASAGPIIYGYRTFQSGTPDATVAGPVWFDADSPADVHLLSDQTELGRCYSGVYYNYKWYGQVLSTGSQTMVDGWYAFDLEDGSRHLISRQGIHLGDMTYNYADRAMYAIDASSQHLLLVDPLTGATSHACNITLDGRIPSVLALAADISGNLYCVTADDLLCRINPESGQLTAVGPLGVDAAFTQSMTFDYSTGTLYWINAADAVLYTIDTATGAATAIGSVGTAGDNICALSIPYINANNGAPDRVTNRRAMVDGNRVELSWNLPVADAQGVELQGDKDINYVMVMRNNSPVAKLPADATSYTDQVAKLGVQSYRIYAVNACGNGAYDTDDLLVAIGPDTPGAVRNLHFDVAEGCAILTWNRPLSGRYGGDFDPDEITGYVIERLHGASSTTIKIDGDATSFYDPQPYGEYSYTVTALNAVGAGETVYTDSRLVMPDTWIVMRGGVKDVAPDIEYDFYDIGGPSANYPNSQRSQLTLRPADDGGYVALSFDKIDIERGYDHLYIYDGDDTDAPLLATLSGVYAEKDAISYVAGNPRGSLTLRFSSDAMENRAGWHGHVVYVAKHTCDLQAIDVVGPTHPTVGEHATFTARVCNRGMRTLAAGDYTVELADWEGKTLTAVPGIDLQPMHTAEFSLDFVPTELYQTSSIYARVVCPADVNPANDASPIYKICVVDAAGYAVRTAENDPLLLVAPASFMSTCSISESIYPASLLGEGGLYISGLSFYYTAQSDCSSVEVDVYVGETDAADLSDGSITADALHHVYSGPMPVRAGTREWSVPCESPHFYEGGNLVVLVNKYGKGSDCGGVNFCGTYDNEGACTVFANNYAKPSVTRFDPFEPFGTASTMLPDLHVLFTSDGSYAVPVAIDPMELKVRIVGSDLIISGVDGSEVSVYGIDGRRVAHVSSAEPQQRISDLSSGVYIVASGGTTVKVAVR